MQKLHQQHLNPRTKYRKPSPTTREDWRLAKEIQKVRQQQLNPEKNTQELHQQQLSPETKYRKPPPTRENWRSPKLPSTLEQLEPWLRTAQLSQQDSSSTWGKEQVKMQLSISFSRRRLQIMWFFGESPYNCLIWIFLGRSNLKDTSQLGTSPEGKLCSIFSDCS